MESSSNSDDNRDSAAPDRVTRSNTQRVDDKKKRQQISESEPRSDDSSKKENSPRANDGSMEESCSHWLYCILGWIGNRLMRLVLWCFLTMTVADATWKHLIHGIPIGEEDAEEILPPWLFKEPSDSGSGSESEE